MTALRRIAVSIGLALAVMGCDTVPPSRPQASSFFAARLQDCKPGAEIAACDSFAPGEVPALVQVNYAGRTVTVRVNDTVTGGMYWNNTEYIPLDRGTSWWSLKTLPSGTYRAEVLVGGTVLQTCYFAVEKATPRRR